MQRDLLRKPLIVVACFGVALLVFTTWLYHQAWAEVVDANSCKSVYMYPSYARIKSFDESHTKFASKYSLYIYREQGKDPVPLAENKGFEILDGIPVLFIPGNAGSFRQVRSIAAEAANLYFDDEIDVVDNPQTRNLDFFAADFNEDFTAFHGRTLLDQAEYLNEAVRFILLLYAHTENPPKSVLIFGHSMGGIVARVLPTLDNYLPESINTIVSLASPHSVPPLTFDGDILLIYLTIDRFWYRAFHDENFSHYGALDNISLVSITGGLTDTVLPADYTTLGYLVPPTNGFTVYTTGIPGVWTPMDHLAIVWCRQLRRSVLKALLEVVNFSSPYRAYSLEKRMAVFKKNFLSGFESYYNEDVTKESRHNKTYAFKLDTQEVLVRTVGRATWRKSNFKSEGTDFSLLPINSSTTLLMISDKKEFDKKMGVYLCKNEGSASKGLDYTNEQTRQFLEMFCVDIVSELHSIPRSAKESTSLEESAFDGDFKPYYALSYNKAELEGYEAVLIVEEPSKPNDGFAIVLTSNEDESKRFVKSSLWAMLFRGVEVNSTSERPLAMNVQILGAASSILAYKVKIKEKSGPLFEPFIRQWLSRPFETKWITNLRGGRTFPISMHGIAPFTPFNTSSAANELNLEFWACPKDELSDEKLSSMVLHLSIDWKNSLKLLVIRFRLAVVSHCLAVTLLVMVFQLRKYSTTGKFPDYYYGLSKLTDLKTLIPTMVLVWLLTPACRQPFVQRLLNLLDPVNLRIPYNYEATSDTGYKTNSLYLGIEETSLSFFGCLFFLMAIGINSSITFLLTSLGRILVIVATCLRSRMTGLASTEAKNTGKGQSTVPIKKLVASAALLLMIPIYLPYQFAYVVCFVIQIFSCLKILWSNSPRSWWNYNFSVLMIMLWVLPINVPILIVFIHNFNLSWATPFSSHHNFLAVAPILVLIELHNIYGDVIPLGFQSKDKKPRLYIFNITIMILMYTIFYSMVYGIRHAFWLHHLFNFWCSWLVIVSICQNLGKEN